MQIAYQTRARGKVDRTSAITSHGWTFMFVQQYFVWSYGRQVRSRASRKNHGFSSEMRISDKGGPRCFKSHSATSLLAQTLQRADILRLSTTPPMQPANHVASKWLVIGRGGLQLSPLVHGRVSRSVGSSSVSFGLSSHSNSRSRERTHLLPMHHFRF